MKRIFLVAMMIVVSLSFGKAQTGQPIKKVAILEVVDRDNSVNYGVKLLLRTSLAKAITQTPGYEGYDRVDMGAIQGEQDFQRTGMVSDEQIKRLGEMTGAAYVLVAEAAKLDANNVIVTAKVLDVETAKLERTDYEQMGIAAKEMADGCRAMSSRLFVAKELVMGRREKTEVASKIELSNEITLESGTQVIRKGACLFIEDEYMNRHPMNRLRMKNYLGNYFRSWNDAKKQRIIGIALLGTGGVLAGVIGLPIGVNGMFTDDMYSDNATVGFSVFAVGIGVVIAGIPTYVIAEKKMNRILQAVEDQQDIVPYRTSVSLNVGSQPHGFGLGLYF